MLAEHNRQGIHEPTVSFSAGERGGAYSIGIQTGTRSNIEPYQHNNCIRGPIEDSIRSGS